MAKTEPVNTMFSVLGPYRQALLTKRHTLLIGIRVQGMDPDGLNADDHQGMVEFFQRVYGNLPPQFSVIQYYLHYENQKISLRKRKNKLCDYLSQQREQFLNDAGLAASSIVHYLEIEPPFNINKFSFTKLFHLIPEALHSSKARKILKASLSSKAAFFRDLEQLEHLHDLLLSTVQQTVQKFSQIFPASIMSLADMWAHQKFLATFDTDQLQYGSLDRVPLEDWDVALPSGDAEHVVLKNIDAIRLPSATRTYVRIASATKLVHQAGGKMIPALWSATQASPTRLRGNYLVMTRWQPLTPLQRSLLFKKKYDDIDRANFDFGVIMGKTTSAADKKAAMREPIRQALEDLGKADAQATQWGHTHHIVATFADNYEALKNTTDFLQRATSQAGVSLTWEKVQAGEAFKSLQPGYGAFHLRDILLNSSQLAASSLYCQTSVGQPTVPDLGHEEAQFVYQTLDGQAFWYSPYTAGKCLVMGIGPPRTGKSFTRLAQGIHSLKYGGMYRAIDIDAGAELLATAFGDDGGVFRLGDTNMPGLVPFTSYRGSDDTHFRPHLTALLRDMLAVNDAEEYKTITPAEQEAIDTAIERTLLLDTSMRTLRNLTAHLPLELRKKFARWLRATNNTGAADGYYAHIFDVTEDALGNISKPVASFNLQALKENPAVMRVVIRELTYRITRVFEDPEHRANPKTLSVDEAHHMLAIPGMLQYLTAAVRTWPKYFVALEMWTQSPNELQKLDDWPVLRSAIGTFMFTADAQLDRQLYQRTFQLTAGQCEAIANMVPQKQIYILQPALGISKIVNLEADNAMYVLNTSQPREVAIRDQYIQQLGFEKGLEAATNHIFAK